MTDGNSYVSGSEASRNQQWWLEYSSEVENCIRVSNLLEDGFAKLENGMPNLDANTFGSELMALVLQDVGDAWEL